MFETPTKSQGGRKEPIKVLNTFILDIPRTSLSEKKTEKKGQSSLRRNTSSRRTSSRKTSNSKKTSIKVSPVDFKSLPNFDFELKKLLRAVFRHCVACPEFKSELKSIEATALLDLYAKNRTMN
jgi:hypothetical protein